MTEAPAPAEGAGVTVLLPSHSYTLTISNLAPGATIADLKRALSEQCPGRPQVSGQRIIMQGRLLADNEVIPQAEPCVVHLAVHPGAWTTTPPSSPRRATTGLPAVSSAPISLAPFVPPPPSNEPPLPLTLQLSSLPTEFITHVHANALRILSGQGAVAWPGPSEVAHARRVARTVIKYAGLGWPPVLEEDLPMDIEPGKGVQYTSVVVDGLPYLALASPDMVPNAAQLKALQVLTYTFPLLPLMKHLPRPAPVASRPRAQQQPAQPQGGQVIRRFGINVRLGAAALPRVPEQGAEGRVLFDDEDPRAYFPPVPEFRFQFHLHLPPSRVLLQLVFTLSRAALLLYFFAPARQPLWVASIVGWIGWEIYVVLRHAGRDGERGRGAAGAGEGGQPNRDGVAAPPAAVVAPGNGNNVPGGNQAAAPAAGGAGAAATGPGAGPNPPETLAPDPAGNELAHFIDRLAIMNLAAESNDLSLAIQTPPSETQTGAAPPVAPMGGGPPQTPVEPPLPGNGVVEAAVEPSLVHKSTTFVALFVTSVVPAVWERRRTRLRQRERWVRDMFVFGRPSVDAAPQSLQGETSTTPPSGAEVAQRRIEGLAGWRRAYVERVISGEAADDGEM